MEGAQDLVLSKVLEADEVDRIELPIRKKLEKFYETRISEFFTAKAISETAQKSIGESRSQGICQPGQRRALQFPMKHFNNIT